MKNYYKSVLILEGFYKGRKGTIIDALSEKYYQIYISEGGPFGSSVLFEKEGLGKTFILIETW